MVYAQFIIILSINNNNSGFRVRFGVRRRRVVPGSGRPAGRVGSGRVGSGPDYGQERRVGSGPDPGRSGRVQVP